TFSVLFRLLNQPPLSAIYTLSLHDALPISSYVSNTGDYTSETDGHAFPTEMDAWFYISAVDVYAEPSAKGAIAILGDSITDGHSSTVNANHRWPDFLADRIQQQGKGNRYSV